jgi:hypothetical protein
LIGWWCGVVWVVQLITLSLPTQVEVQLGCDNMSIEISVWINCRLCSLILFCLFAWWWWCLLGLFKGDFLHQIKGLINYLGSNLNQTKGQIKYFGLSLISTKSKVFSNILVQLLTKSKFGSNVEAYIRTKSMYKANSGRNNF